jgi:hypothetical protein
MRRSRPAPEQGAGLGRNVLAAMAARTEIELIAACRTPAKLDRASPARCSLVTFGMPAIAVPWLKT